MNDISDLMFTMGSLVIFSILLLQTNSTMLRNDLVVLEQEYQRTAIAMAQSLIDEARMKPFDEALLDNPGKKFNPDDFRTTLGPPQNATRSEFAVFDHYDGYQEIIDTPLGPYQLSATVYYVTPDEPYEISAEATNIKKIEAVALSLFTGQPIQLHYLMTYF